MDGDLNLAVGKRRPRKSDTLPQVRYVRLELEVAHTPAPLSSPTGTPQQFRKSVDSGLRGWLEGALQSRFAERGRPRELPGAVSRGVFRAWEGRR